MSDFETREGVARAGGLTGNRDLIITPNILRWVAEGKVFSAGVGYESAGIDDIGVTLDDETPDFGLYTSTSTTTFILPLLVRLSIHTEGGYYPRIIVGITRQASDCATTLARSAGTALPSVINHNIALNNAPTATAYYTCTNSALTNADFVAVIKAVAADNPTSGTGGLGFNKGTVFELDLSKDPHLLAGGAALLVYPNTQTTDTKWCPYIMWAELTADDLY